MSRLSEEEQRLIKRAVAEGRVTQVPTGASAFAVEYRWCDAARTLVPVDRENQGWRGGDSFQAQRNARARRVTERRAKVVRLMDRGLTAVEISARLRTPLGTIYDDARKSQRRFCDTKNGVT